MRGYILGIREEAINAPAAVCAFAIVTLAAAYLSQYWGGLVPCELCYWQRYPYFAVIPMTGVAYLIAREVPRNSVTTTLMSFSALAMYGGAGIAAYHVGVEYGWWPGPDACASAVGGSGSLEDELAAIMAAPIVRCEEVQWSLLGISMAGYNFIMSIFLGSIAFVGVIKSRR